MFKHLTLSLACLATVNTGFSNTVNISTAVGAPTTSAAASFLLSTGWLDEEPVAF